MAQLNFTDVLAQYTTFFGMSIIQGPIIFFMGLSLVGVCVFMLLRAFGWK